MSQAAVHRPPAVAEFLFAIAGFVVLASIVLHGITSTPAMRHLQRKE